MLGAKVVLPNGRMVQLGGKSIEYPGYDLLGVMVGSEGTVGLATEAGIALPL
jgi:glycolate oxidase